MKAFIVAGARRSGHLAEAAVFPKTAWTLAPSWVAARKLFEDVGVAA
jgi:hypothetical protein